MNTEPYDPNWWKRVQMVMVDGQKVLIMEPHFLADRYPDKTPTEDEDA